MAMHEPGRTKGFPCKQCGIVYSNMPSLLEHMDAHHQHDEERRFKCDECGRGYRHAGSLANHRKTHDVGNFQCQICGRENSNALALKSHLRSHTSQKKYTCEECGKSFRLASQLATHERVHLSRQVRGVPFRRGAGADYDDEMDDEDEEAQHLADELSAGAAGVSPDEDSEDEAGGGGYNAEAEGAEDTGNRPHKCDLCDKSYIHHRSLTYHKKTHQMGMFECTVCPKLFNNMAALASHQRSHKTPRGGAAVERGGAAQDGGGPYADAQSDQFSPQSGEAAVNFCHLCQVLFPNDEEFQEHIQMHNSSSLSFGHHDGPPDNRNVSYDNSIASPESNFYASPVNNVPSASSSMDNHRDLAQEQIMNNGHMYSDCDRTASGINAQGEASSLMDDVDELNEMEENSAADSGDRRFKCNVCGKSYRHSGSLINHKRSHQVGIYQCSICRKSYPHLAALKSHLRLHKAQPSAFSVSHDGDWLSSEPLTLDSQQGCLSSQEDDDAGSLLGLDQDPTGDPGDPGDGGALLHHEQFGQDFAAGSRTVHLPHDEHLMQRHMCADCGETFADIAGIKSHGCPLLQQHHQHHAGTANGYGGDMSFINGSGQCAVAGDPGGNVEFLNGGRDQGYFGEQGYPGDASGGPLNGDCIEDEEEEGEEEEEEEDDGELYQCSVCGNRYTSQRALRSHLRGHTQAHGTPASSGPSSMSSHEEQRDDEAGEMMMICSTCGESFGKRQDLLAHQLLHNKARLDAEDAGDGGHHPLANNNHNNNHHDNHNNHHDDGTDNKEEAESIICGGCGIFCSSYRHLENHGCGLPAGGRREEPVPVAPVVVPRGRERVKVNDVDVKEAAACMKENVDLGDRQYKCDQCGRTYRHAGSLLNHKKSHKTGVFRCLVCQKRFYNLLALKNHQRSHFDVKRHTCHECGKAFKIQKQLLTHLRRHKENQAKIQELNDQIKALMQMNGEEEGAAGAATTQASGSARRPHHPQGKAAKAKTAIVKSEGTGDLRPFSCDQCGRTYRHAGSLFNHMNSHKTGEYCCSVCDNTYSNQLAMKNHLRTHFALKRHTCPSCGRGFRGKKQLSAHVCAGHLRKEGAVARVARPQRTRSFKCKACKQPFPSVDQLAGHVCVGVPAKNGGGGGGGGARRGGGVSMKKEERPYTCNVCSRTYRHAGSLLNHKNTHKTGHFSCTFCSKPFTNPMALRNHTRIHTQKKKYVCLTCGKAFRLASILHNHQKTHSRAASHFSCPACGKSFHGKSGLKRHRCHRGGGGTSSSSARPAVQPAEGGDKCFMCDLCGRSYRHAGSLLNHKKSHSESLHHCALCLQTFPDPLTLQIHSQMKRHCCPVCGKTFCLLAHLQSHMEVHAKDRPVVCSPCQQSFPSVSAYQQHQDAHHGAQGHYHHHHHHQHHQQQQHHGLGGPGNNRWDSGVDHQRVDHQRAGLERLPKLASPYSQGSGGGSSDRRDSGGEGGAGSDDKSHVCEHCGRAYRHAGSLLNHKNSHKTGSFYCAVCQKEFSNLMALKNHRRIHTEPKRYQCLECGKAFRVSTQLICHRRIHTKEKPFACLLCDKSFSSKSNLRHHQKMHQSAQAYDASFSMDANAFMDLDMGSFL